MHTLAVVLALVSGVSKGGKLYVKGDGVAMTAKADGSGASTPLPAGTEVIWEGADAKHTSMNLVEVNGKKGYLPMSSLTPNKAAEEFQTTTRAAAAGEDQVLLERLRALHASTEEQKAKLAEHAKKNGLKVAR